jgi:surface antigen
MLVALISLPTGASPVRADTTAQLEAERAQLLQELAAISSQQSAATGALTTAEATFAQATQALNADRDQLNKLNSELASLNGSITNDRAQSAAARNALATLTRATYESVSGDTVMTAVLSAKDFTAAMDSISGASSAATQIRGLENTLAYDESDLSSKQSQLQADFSQASELETQLTAQSNQMLAIVYERDQVLQQFSGPAEQIAAQIDEIDDELGGNVSVPGSSCSNDFAYGDCTWYVATRRCIPWGGNADQWYYNASRMGYQEGPTPEVGAVAVWIQGEGGSNSWYGHVAYVEAIGPNTGVGSIAVVPAGFFEISEMNWGGWDSVDYRLIPDSATYFQGFVYGPG